METASSRSKARTYGGWAKPRKAGYKGWSLAQTVVAFAGVPVAMIVWQIFGLIAFLVALVAVAAAILLLGYKDTRHDVALFERIGERIMWKRRKRKGEHVYRSGLQSPSGTFQLPGVLSQTVVTEHEDSFGRPFALLQWKGTGVYTVVFVTEPTGRALVDTRVVNGWVANLAEFLTSLGDQPEILQSQIVVETTPDSGGRLGREVHSNLSDSAPEAAREMFDEILDSYPVGGTKIRAYVALSVDARPYTGAKPRSSEQMGRDMASFVAQLSQMLPAVGSGQTRPLDAYGLAAQVRCAYDPAAAEIFDQAELAGDRVALSWEDAGPVATQMPDWETYRHDSGVSATWMMTAAPRQNVFADVLEPLLAPDSLFASKRVSLMYRPIEAGRASDIAQADRNAAFARASQGKASDARSHIRADNAQATAEAEATGSGIGELGMVVTATVTDPDSMERARERIVSLSRQSKVLLRPAYGSQDAMFVAGLPVGMIPEKFSKIPDYVRDAL